MSGLRFRDNQSALRWAMSTGRWDEATARRMLGLVSSPPAVMERKRVGGEAGAIGARTAPPCEAGGAISRASGEADADGAFQGTSAEAEGGGETGEAFQGVVVDPRRRRAGDGALRHRLGRVCF